MKRFLLFCTVMITISCGERETYRFEIGEDDGILRSGPVVLNVPAEEGENQWALKKKEGEKYIPVPFQNGEDNDLLFVHDGGRAFYTIERVDTGFPVNPAIQMDQKDGNLSMSINGKPLVQYRYEMTYPPRGVDSVFGKSGYLHPIRTPSGDTLSRIQPPDHYHHYGMWGPWTHTQIKGQQVDFWNLGDRKGTVLFRDFKSKTSGTVSASFNAAQEHIDFITETAPQIALNENLEVRLWDLNRPDRYMFDYNTTFRSPLENGILFEAYRYGGGIGMRFTERWHKDNCSVLTSEGNDRLTADGSNARWCIVSGESADGKGTNGVLFMSHPTNRKHPEPMRVWPIDGNGGRGDMFFEFCPIRHEEWRIEPNKDYGLQYRMVVFDGELNAEEAEAYWQAFANPIELDIEED